MADFEHRCEVLTAENEALRLRVAELEEQLGVTFDAPPFLGLTGQEAKLFGVFLAREAVTKRLAMDVLYGNKPDGDAAEDKIIDVFVCKLRAKLKPFGLEIGTNWGQGYFMDAANKAKVRALIEPPPEEAA